MSLRTSDNAGFTIIEMLVAVTLFGIMSTGVYQVLIAQTGGADTTRSLGKVADEARLGFNRMVRDVREADAITWVSGPENQFTINVNFNDDAYYQNPNAQDDDEVLTYTFDSTAGTISLCNALEHSACTPATSEVLMAGVGLIPGKQPFTFTSTKLEYDWGVPYGTTSWQELDEASDPATHNVVGVGNNNDAFDNGEWPFITTVAFALRLTHDGNSTDFYSTVQMRNKG